MTEERRKVPEQDGEGEKIPYTAIRSPQHTNNHATVIVEGDEETFHELMHIISCFKQKMHEQQKDFSYAIIGVKPYPRIG